MKKRLFSASRWALTGLTLVTLSTSGLAQNVSVEAGVAVQANAGPITLSAGVQEVLDLALAHVGDEVIIPFVEASGRSYDLAATEIVYLRDKGVSDRVLGVMLRQRSKARTAPATTTRPQNTQPSTAVVQSAPSYATAPTTAYVVREPAPTYYYEPYDYYPYSYPYYGSYGFPSLSFNFGFGGGRHHGGYYGGHHGGHYGAHGGHYGGHHGGGHGRGHR